MKQSSATQYRIQGFGSMLFVRDPRILPVDLLHARRLPPVAWPEQYCAIYGHTCIVYFFLRSMKFIGRLVLDSTR